MDQFRKLMSVVLLAGLISGLLLFAVQHFTVIPLIQAAEVYEARDEQTMAGMHHEAEGWHPSDGLERTSYTALATVLTGIGFAAVFFGVITALRPIGLNWKKGALLGLAAFVCVQLAPALGLPPRPPGVPVADIYARQLWWVSTAVLAALGIWFIQDGRKPWFIRSLGLIGLVLPQLIGAPMATGYSSVPLNLIREFAVASLLTMGMFWIALGSIGGMLYQRFGDAEQP